MSERNDYTEDRADADELIAEFGQDGTLRRPTVTGPVYDPTPGEPDDHDATFVVLDYTNREIDGSRVLATDKKVYLAIGDLTITPALTDKLLIGGVEHSIVRVEPLAPGGVTVFHQLQCRR